MFDSTMPKSGAALIAEFVRFAGVGAVGFLVDLAATLIGVEIFRLAPHTARLIAIVIAVSVTFALNRTFTFHSKEPRLLQQVLRYALVSAVGAGINFAVYSGCLALVGGASTPLLSGAVAAGSAVAMLVNYAGSRIFAFSK